jgi:hypothetical protein
MVKSYTEFESSVIVKFTAPVVKSLNILLLPHFGRLCSHNLSSKFTRTGPLCYVNTRTTTLVSVFNNPRADIPTKYETEMYATKDMHRLPRALRTMFSGVVFVR